MAFQSVPETAQITVVCSPTAGKDAVMTFYARKSGGYNLAALQALATTVDGWGATPFRPTISNAWTYLRTEVRGLEFENDQVAESNAGTGVGGLASPRLPSNVTLAVKRASGLTGRSARGRVYWIGLGEGDVANDEVLQVRVDAIVSALNNLHAAIILTAWENVVVSRRNAGVVRPVGVTFPFGGWSVTNNMTDSQRGRLPEGH